VLYAVWGLSKLYADKNVCKNNLCMFSKEKRGKKENSTDRD
jgi:hypothetical protein